MFKKLFFIAIISFSSLSFGQYKTITFTNSLKTTSTNLKETIPIVNQKNGDAALFLMDSKKIYGYLFDSHFDIKNELSSDKRRRKYKKTIGYSISETNDYRLFLTTVKNDKFATIDFSFSNHTSTLKELDLNLKNERFLQTVVYKNTFYLITIIKGTSILIFYKFDNKGNFEKNMVNLTKERFINLKDKSIKLDKLLTGFSGVKDIKKIEEDNPNTIELTSEDIKMYLRESSIVFTLDSNRNFTQIIAIDLDTFSTIVKQVQKPLIAVKRAFKKTNSYLFGDYLFMIAATDLQLEFSIKDYKSGKEIKKYFVTSKDSILFKNTPIIQTGGAYNNYRELGKTKKFLRKITKQDIGVSVYQDKDKYHITLGGKKDLPKGGGMMMPMGAFGGIPIASFGAVNVFFNPAFFAYYSYASTKAVHITGLFDKNFNHLEGEIPENIFDKIEQFKADANTSLNGETVFRYNDYYIYGHYNSTNKDYTLVMIK